MKTATIHAAFTETTYYTWGADVVVRHTEKGEVKVQFGGTDRFEDPYEAEFLIADKIIAGSAIEFSDYKVVSIEVYRFTRASDARLG